MNVKMIIIGVLLIFSPLIVAYLINLVGFIYDIIQCLKHKGDIALVIDDGAPVIFGTVGGIGVMLIVYGVLKGG